MLKNLFYFIPFILLISACSKPANDGIPSYVKIESVALTTTIDQGSNLHDINSLWIETEGDNLGVFEFPNVIPVLAQGNRDFIFNAGVYQSGDFFIREIYPCYQVFQSSTTLIEKDTVVINPTFMYKPEANFLLVEGFETGNAFTGITRTDNNDPVNLEGRAGAIYLTSTNPAVLGTTGNTLAIPQGPKVYLEIHCKNSNFFKIGIESLVNGSVDQGVFFAGINASDEWQKLYIDLTQLINNLNGDEYNFLIEANKDSGLTESTVFIDNFKIVTL